MANINPNNNGFASGRLVNDPKVWENDRTVTIKVKVALEQHYPGADGKFGADFPEFTAFLKKDENYKGLGVYGNVRKGDRVNLNYALRNNNHPDKNGQMIYEIQLVVVPGSFIPQETKEVRDQSHAKLSTPAPAAPAAVSAPVADAPVADTPAEPSFASAAPAGEGLDDVLASLGINN